MPNRRDFILQTCSFCAAAAGWGFIVSQLESCKTPEGAKTEVVKPEVTKGLIMLPIKAFDSRKNYLVTDLSLEFPVLVVMYPDGSYAGLQMRCTHKGEPLRITPNNLVCDAHGSEFDFNGNVTHSPASTPLKKYPATVENGRVVVNLNA